MQTKSWYLFMNDSSYEQFFSDEGHAALCLSPRRTARSGWSHNRFSAVLYPMDRDRKWLQARPRVSSLLAWSCLLMLQHLTRRTDHTHFQTTTAPDIYNGLYCYLNNWNNYYRPTSSHQHNEVDCWQIIGYFKVEYSRLSKVLYEQAKTCKVLSPSFQ